MILACLFVCAVRIFYDSYTNVIRGEEHMFEKSAICAGFISIYIFKL